jgi:hypothetical protein
MFSPDIVSSDAFLDMPISSQALYFHLGMNADDDGFVNPKRIIKVINAGDDDLKVLLSKRFLLPFDDGVVVIKHWLIHNMIRKDRYKPTQYIEDKKTLIIKENGAYTDSRQPNGTQMAPQVRLGKVSIGKDRSGQDRIGKDTCGVPPRDVNSFIDLFKSINPTYERLFNNKTERDCSERLIKKFGLEKMTSMFERLPNILNQPYAPRISTPNELEKNLGKLLQFIEQHNSIIKKTEVAFT